MKRKLIYGFIISIIFLILLCSNKVEASTVYNSQISYIENADGTLTVEATNKEVVEVIIPAEINGKLVTKIADYGFYNCKNLENIILPDSIIEIGEQAFSMCEKIRKIRIPTKVKEIKNETFFNCVQLEIVEFPKTLEKIGTGAFYKCAITDITWPENIKVLENQAFMNCNYLKNIVIPNGVTKIGDGAFAHCSNLKSIVFPNTITELGGGIIQFCTELESVTLPNNITKIEVIMFAYCEKIEKIELPDSIKEIADYAFLGCGSLKNIELPKNLVKLGKMAFGKCSSLQKIYFPENIKSIANEELTHAFVEIPTNQLIIYGYKGTVAQSYASEKGYKFIPLNQFADVKTTDWYYNSVLYVFKNKIILGKTDSLFKPNDKLTRGQLVTILWRMAGGEIVDAPNKFIDVKANDYYYDAVKWASAKKVVSGVSNDKFAPNKNITREQLAVMLNNYARYKKINIAQIANISNFTDAKGISDYAVDAVKWAIGNKIMNGKDKGTRIDPRGNTTRAEASAMIQNYCIYVK